MFLIPGILLRFWFLNSLFNCGQGSSCHYGLMSTNDFYFSPPLVEGECAWKGNSTHTESYKFSCNGSDSGSITTYHGQDCDTSQIKKKSILSEGSFDCSTNGTCDTASVSLDLFTGGDSNSSCTIGNLDASFYATITNLSHCDENEFYYVSTWVGNDFVEIDFYNYEDSTCSEKPFSEIHLTDEYDCDVVTVNLTGIVVDIFDFNFSVTLNENIQSM